MKAYLITSGTIFGGIVVAHICRMFVEAHVRGEPGYLLLTALAAGLCVWAFRLLRRLPR